MSSTDKEKISYPHHIPLIPYVENATSLQTLDIWLPRPLPDSSPEETLWIIYIHGGAYRDPDQTSLTIYPTLSHLFSSSTPSTLSSIAALASINYNLSPYPTHPTNPSSPDDKSRNAKHPSHIDDVKAAMDFLAREYGVGSRFEYVGIGHSCGATLWCQYLSSCFSSLSRDADIASTHPPRALVLLAGIYDFPALIQHHSPPNVSHDTARIYRDFVTGAFGDEEEEWKRVSPVNLRYRDGDGERGRNKRIWLCQSPEDGLVEWGQVEGMGGCLGGWGWCVGGREVGDGWEQGKEGGNENEVLVHELSGTHDEVWEDGGQIFELLGRVVRWWMGVRGKE